MAYLKWVIKEILVKRSFTKGLGKETVDIGTVSKGAITALGLKKQGGRNDYWMKEKQGKEVGGRKVGEGGSKGGEPEGGRVERRENVGGK